MELAELIIDPEFETNNPKLTSEERKQLEENILTDGVVNNPLIVWNKTIIDGHNRYRILLEHPEIPFSIKEKQFKDKCQAIVWICKNQLGRRNLTLEQRKYLIAKQYDAEKGSYGAANGFRGNQYSESEVVSGQNGHLPKMQDTREKIAKENNISKGQVRHCLDYTKGVDAAEEIEPGIKDKLLNREIIATAKDVAAVAKATPEKRKELVENLQKPKDKKKESATIERIRAISEGMLQSEGIAATTVDDMNCEMEDALSDMIWRWENCRETYPKIICSEEGKKVINRLVQEGMDFLKKVENGGLWK